MYQLDKQSAENGSGSSSNYLEEGLHEVTVEQAYEFTAGTGAKGVHIDFKSKSGATRGLNFYTVNKDGEHIFGMDQLQAIMAVTKIRSINPQSGTVKVRRFNEQANAYEDQQIQAPVLMELVGKQLGIIIHKEANTYEGRTRARYNMTAPLVAGTNQTAIEVLNSKEATSWESLLRNAESRSEKAAKEIAASGNQPASQTAGESYGGGDAYDDDIPFCPHLKNTVI
jgi:hypothetical protein